MRHLFVTTTLAALFVIPAMPAEAADFTGRVKRIKVRKRNTTYGYRMTVATPPGNTPPAAAMSLAFGPDGSQHNTALKQRNRGRYTYMFWIKARPVKKGWSNILHKGRINTNNGDGKELGSTVALELKGGDYRHHRWLSLDGIYYSAALRARLKKNPAAKGKKQILVEWTVHTAAPGSTKDTLGFDWQTQVSITLSGDAIKKTATVTGTAAEHRVDFSGNVGSVSDKALPLGGLKVGQFLPVVGVALDADGQPTSTARIRSVLAEDQNDGDDFGELTNTYLAYRGLPQVEKKGRGLYEFAGKIVSINGGEAGMTETFNFIHEVAGSDGKPRNVLLYTNTSGKLKSLANSQVVVQLNGTKTRVTLKLGGHAKPKGNFNTLGIANQGVPVLISSWGAVLD